MKANKRNLFYQNTAPNPKNIFIKRLYLIVLWFLGGFFAGRFTLLNEIYIGSIGYITVSAYSGMMIPAFLGCAVGRLTLGFENFIPLSLIPEVICFSVFYLMNIIKYRPKKQIYMLIAAVSRLPLLAISPITAYGIFIFCVSTILLIGLVFCFITSYASIKEKDIKQNIIYIIASFSILLSGLPDFSFFDISLYMVLASITILLCAVSLGAPYAGAAGAVIGLSMAMTSDMGFEYGGMLAMCGLVAGALYRYGKFICIPIYLASSVILSLLYKNDVYYLMNLQTLLFSGIIFSFIPNSFIFSLTKQADIQERIHRWRSLDSVSKKIMQLSKCLSSLKNVFDDIAIDESKILNNSAPILEEIHQRCCSGCKNEKNCWEKNLYNTYRVLGSVVSNWNENNSPDTSKIPKSFMKQCLDIPELIKSIDETYRLYVLKKKTTKKITESKKLIRNHLQGSSLILEQMSEEVSENFLTEQERIYQALAGFNNIILPINEKNGEYGVRCKPCGSMGTCHIYARKISKATNMQHTINARRCGSSSTPCSITIAPAKGLDVFYSVAQKPKSGTLCGDAFAMTHLASGSHLIAVADGMGSGPRASLEAKAAIELLREFLNTGFDEDTVFSIINRALLLRSGTETFAALDACIINPINRYYRFLKVGAPASYIFRKGEFIKIQSPSMPLGIMETADCACIQREAYPGDIIVLSSDGFDPSNLSPEQFEKNTLIKKLPRTLLHSNDGAACDDVTIITAKIKSPPAYTRRNKQLDEWKLRIASGAH